MEKEIPLLLLFVAVEGFLKVFVMFRERSLFLVLGILVLIF